MTGPPDSKTPGSAVTGPGVEKETGGEASFIKDDSSDPTAMPVETNVVSFRPKFNGKPHPYVGVQISAFKIRLPYEISVALVGPIMDGSCYKRGGRSPYHVVQSFVVSDDPTVAMLAAADLACVLANDFQLEMFDEVGLEITCERVPSNEPGAA